HLLTGKIPTLGEIPALCSDAEALIETHLKSAATVSNEPFLFLRQTLCNGSDAAQYHTNRALELMHTAVEMFDEMDFAFLLDKKRQLLSIGYRVDDSTLDASHYDLLASEARLA